MQSITQKIRKIFPSEDVPRQRPFSSVASLLQTALLMGASGGFLLATLLTLTRAFSIPLGPWWAAIAQAHGHLQLYGWAGLFVLGVALHFLPRLRGTPLAGVRTLPWLMGLMIVSMSLRAISQPLQTFFPSVVWSILLISSGVGELGAVAMVLAMLSVTAYRGPRSVDRPAYWSVVPLLFGAFSTLGIASVVNLLNVIQAARGDGLIATTGDTLNVTLGLFGFLLPLALAMSARSLPMYAGLESFPRRVLWPIAFCYFTGLLLLSIGTLGIATSWNDVSNAAGMLLIGSVILLFITLFLHLMRTRGHLPQRITQLAPAPIALQHTYQGQVKKEQVNFGPFVALVASSYLWAMLGALLLLIDGVGLLTTGSMPIAFDAIRHSFAIGFIALLLCGVAPRMVPSFSGGKIASPKLVSATLWLGNLAAVLRVGSLLFAPQLAQLHLYAFDTFLFGFSGPCGLALAICLAVNLWPALRKH